MIAMPNQNGEMTPEDIEYWYSERAAILHFDGGFEIEEAERLARYELENEQQRRKEIAK